MSCSWRAPALCSIRLASRVRDRGPAGRRVDLATARSATPTRPAAAPTRVHARISAGSALVAAAALLIDYILTVAVSTGVGDRADRVGRSPTSVDVRIEIGVVSIAPDHRGQPARPARVGQHLCGPDLPVRRPGPADDRDRRSFRIVVRTGHALPAPPRRRAVRGGAANASFCSCAHSPAGRSRSPEPRRSPTASRPSSRPRRKNAANTLIMMASCWACCSSGSPSWPMRFAIRPSADGEGGPTVIAQVAGTDLWRRLAPVLSCSRPVRPCSCSWPRTRASTRSRGSPRSLPTTASCHASSASGAIGWPTRGGSSLLASGRRRPADRLQRGYPRPDSALLGRRVRHFTLAQTGMVLHWRREREPGWRWRA